MNAREQRQFQALLEGRLSARQAQRLLDRIREQDDYREQLQFSAQTAATLSHVPQDGPRYQPVSFADVEAARHARPQRRLRWTIFSLFMIVILTATGIMARQDEVPAGLTVNRVCRDTLSRGLPFLLHPKGERQALPRVLELYLPVDSEQVLIRIRHAGQVLFEKTFSRRDPGVTFSPAEGQVDDQTYPLLEALLPFPATSLVSLQAGTPYDFIASIDGLGWSTPLGFSIAR